MEYLAYIHKEGKSDFGVSFPDFPGCVTAGRTFEEALRMAAEALAFHIEGMKADHQPIPEPSTFAELKNDPNRRDAAGLVLIQAPEERTTRFNITARASQIAKIDRLAKQHHMSRSEYMVKCASREIPADEELAP